MQITLPPELASFVEEQVRAGRYESAEGMVQAALVQLRLSEELSPEDIAELREEVAIGLEQAEQGQFVEFTTEDVIVEGREILAKKQKVG